MGPDCRIAGNRIGKGEMMIAEAYRSGDRAGRLAALREVREWVDGQQYGYGEGYNEGFDLALEMVVRNIDTRIKREEGK